MSNQTMLLAGAGITGPMLAYWPARQGFRPMVSKRAAALRSSRIPVLVRGGRESWQGTWPPSCRR